MYCDTYLCRPEKAFDTVSSDINLKKLEAYGIRGNLLKLCESSLNDRYQYNVFNGVKSVKKVVTSGVPQGSILGPLFFLVCLNNIFKASQFLHNILYADDTCIYLSVKEPHSLINLMSTELD